MKEALAAAQAFGAGENCVVTPLGRGNIHDTFLACDKPKNIVLQRLSEALGADSEALMRNVGRVCAHWAAVERDPRRRLTPVRGRTGQLLWRDKAGRAWRAYDCIDGALSYDKAETAEQAREAARAFGRFLNQMSGLPLSEVSSEFLQFHDGLKRFSVFEKALAADERSRAKDCRAEIEFIKNRKDVFVSWEDIAKGGAAPRRVVHNDTKISNVLFDAGSGKSLCVVDLDTVSAGFLVFDFGDLVRSTVTGKSEDETALSSLPLRMDIFRALVDGFLSEVGGMLTIGERGRLVFGAKFIALELGMRFLTDYLSGDVYFKTARPGQNLDRARTQLKIVELIEREQKALEAVVSEHRAGS